MNRRHEVQYFDTPDDSPVLSSVNTEVLKVYNLSYSIVGPGKLSSVL